ncbi:MAG: VOC family protein [Proteobacteria bacterium]|nr:MAG: VOC family protein [Pseudomonadota bacterium]
MVDHIMLMVKDKEASEAFYIGLLKALGASLIHGGDTFSGFGKKGSVPFWLKKAEDGKETVRMHVAFSATTRATVREFYAAALKLGGRSNGEPGLRPEHGNSYYTAYIYDLDGHNIEAVCYAEGEV